MKRFSKIIGVLMCILLLISNVVYADTPMVVLDAGHGGADSGAISLDGEYLEKVWNLQTTKSCKKTLEKYGVDVVMTREDDIFLWFCFVFMGNVRPCTSYVACYCSTRI